MPDTSLKLREYILHSSSAHIKQFCQQYDTNSLVTFLFHQICSCKVSILCLYATHIQAKILAKIDTFNNIRNVWHSRQKNLVYEISMILPPHCLVLFHLIDF